MTSHMTSHYKKERRQSVSDLISFVHIIFSTTHRVDGFRLCPERATDFPTRSFLAPFLFPNSEPHARVQVPDVDTALQLSRPRAPSSSSPPLDFRCCSVAVCRNRVGCNTRRGPQEEKAGASHCRFVCKRCRFDPDQKTNRELLHPGSLPVQQTASSNGLGEPQSGNRSGSLLVGFFGRSSISLAARFEVLTIKSRILLFK